MPASTNALIFSACEFAASTSGNVDAAETAGTIADATKEAVAAVDRNFLYFLVG